MKIIIGGKVDMDLIKLWNKFFEWRHTKNKRLFDIKDHSNERYDKKFLKKVKKCGCHR